MLRAVPVPIGGQSACGESALITETIRDKVDQVPFQPFVVRANSGDGYKVSNPDLVVLMKSKVFIAQPNSDRAATVPYLHIAAVEELDTGNGKRPRRGKRR